MSRFSVRAEALRSQTIREQDIDKFRWYNRDGQKYISVTAVLDVAQHYKLTNWFKNNSKNKIAKTKDSTATTGKELHALIEKDLNGEDLVIPEAYEKPFENWQKLKSEKSIKAKATELMVVSKKYGFAGQLDSLIEGKFKKPLNIADLKTGRFGIKTGWQMAAYRQAAIEDLEIPPDTLGMVGINVHRDGQTANIFEYEHIFPCFEAFLSCLEIFKMLYFNKLNKMKWPYLKDNGLKKWWGVIDHE